MLILKFIKICTTYDRRGHFYIETVNTEGSVVGVYVSTQVQINTKGFLLQTLNINIVFNGS